MAKELYKKYYRRIAREGILKALFIALAAGSVVLALTEFISWIFGFKAGLWIGFLAFAMVTAALTPLIYLKKYRPTAKAIARRVDALGLEERMITMTELEADESYIAHLQREDTEKALKSVDQSLIKIAISTSLIATLCVCATFGLGFVTTEALHVAGIIPSVIGIAENINEKENIYTVSYGVLEGEGTIVCYTEDLSAETPFDGPVSVKEGEDAPAVYALPDTDENWVFVRWSDGLMSPYRKDLGVSGNINVNAVFAQLSDLDVPDPQLPSNGSTEPGEGDESQDGDQSQPPDSGDNGSGDGAGDEGGGSRNDANQQIYDGEHYYGDDYNNAVDEANGRLDSDDSLDDDRKGWIDDYFGSIEKGGSGSGEQTP